MAQTLIRTVARAITPQRLRRQIGRWRDQFNERFARWKSWPWVGFVRFGDFRSLTPLGEGGYPQHAPRVDEYYVARFLSAHRAVIHGRICILDPLGYFDRYQKGQDNPWDDRDLSLASPEVVTIATVDELAKLPSDQFDCILAVHCLQFVWDLRSLLEQLHSLLKPGGLVLATMPGIGPWKRVPAWSAPEYWRFTSRTVKQLFAEIFPRDTVQVTVWGNVLASLALLHELPANTLRPEELDHVDPMYQIVITVQAGKPRDVERMGAQSSRAA